MARKDTRKTQQSLCYQDGHVFTYFSQCSEAVDSFALGCMGEANLNEQNGPKQYSK